MNVTARKVVTCSWASWCRRVAITLRSHLGNGAVIAVCSDHAGDPVW